MVKERKEPEGGLSAAAKVIGLLATVLALLGTLAGALLWVGDARWQSQADASAEREANRIEVTDRLGRIEERLGAQQLLLQEVRDELHVRRASVGGGTP